MCNLFTETKPREALRQAFKIRRDLATDRPTPQKIRPDDLSLVVTGDRDLEVMRWGFPFRDGSLTINVRFPEKTYWQPFMGAENRCLVPVSTFAEFTEEGPKRAHWYGLKDERPFAFAGIWREWQGTRKGQAGLHRVYAFLTTEANGLVAEIHPSAMPVLLTEDMWDIWLRAPAAEALALQRPLDSALMYEAPPEAPPPPRQASFGF
jgi:putative SOS response-associated peptidase YedK